MTPNRLPLLLLLPVVALAGVGCSARTVDAVPPAGHPTIVAASSSTSSTTRSVPTGTAPDGTPSGSGIPSPHTWTRTNPGGGGAIAVVGATASGVLVAASDLSGVYRSTDAGATWDVLGATQGLTETHTSSLGFHPVDGNVFFVGTGWGAFKTTDGGDHFTRVHPDGYIEDIVISPSNTEIGYMAYHEDWDTPGEVFKTIDGGDSWHPVDGQDLPGDLRIVKLLVHPLDERVVYALGGKSRWGCSDAALFRSEDGGVHWSRVGAELAAVLDVDVDPSDPATVYASTFEANPCAPSLDFDDYLGGDETSGAFFRSGDGGKTWRQLSDVTGIISVEPGGRTIRLIDMLYPYDWNDAAGAWQTDDGGETWTHTGFVSDWDTGWATNQYFAFAYSFNGLNKTLTRDLFHPDRFYGSFGQWAWASFDGGITMDNISTRRVAPGRWRSTGLDNINGHALAVSTSNPDTIYMGGYDIGLWTSRDRGSSWRRSIPDNGRFPDYVWSEGQGANVTTLVVDPARDGVLWAAFHREGFGNDATAAAGTTSALFTSTDYGASWSLANGGLPDATMFHGLSLDPDSDPDARVLYLTVSGDVYRSRNGGASWQMILANGGLRFTSIDAENRDLVYAGGENGLWRSSDAGDIWSEVGLAAMRGSFVGNFLPTTDGWEGVFQVVADPVITRRVYAVVLGEGKGLYRSDDAGVTWVKLYDDPFLRGVAIAPADPDVIYATSSPAYFSGGYDPRATGIVYSRDGGTTWDTATEGMAWPFGGRIVVSPGSEPYVIAWSPGTGVQIADVPFPIRHRPATISPATGGNEG